MNSCVVTPADEVGRKLLERYIERRRADAKLLVTLIQDRKIERIRRIGHNWIGSGTAYELPRISILGERLTRAVECDNPAEAAAVVEDLIEFLDSVIIAPPA